MTDSACSRKAQPCTSPLSFKTAFQVPQSAALAVSQASCASSYSPRCIGLLAKTLYACHTKSVIMNDKRRLDNSKICKTNGINDAAELPKTKLIQQSNMQGCCLLPVCFTSLRAVRSKLRISSYLFAVHPILQQMVPLSRHR